MSDVLNPALQNLDAERSVLGAILLDEQHLSRLTVDEHLAPEHFSIPAHQAIYRAAIELQGTGRSVDHLTITAHLEDAGELDMVGGALKVEELTTWVPATGNAAEYGRIVRERHQARALLYAAERTRAEVLGREAPIDELIERAEQRLTSVIDDGRHGREQHTFMPEDIRHWYFDSLGQTTGVTWRTPFAELDDMLTGGLRPGEMTLIGGWGKHGKSVITDQFLETLAAQDLNVHLYINEMTRRSRVDRMVARLSGVNFKALRTRKLDPEQRKKAAAVMDQIKIGITECASWTAPEIARHIKRNRWDACCVDIAHNIPRTEAGTSGADAIAQELRGASLQANTLLLVTVHLNNARSIGAQNPPPVARDIRDTGMWDRLADHVLFIYREETEDGIPTTKAALIAARVRDGEPKIMKLTFQPERMRFTTLSVINSGETHYDPNSRIESSSEFEAGF